MPLSTASSIRNLICSHEILADDVNLCSYRLGQVSAHTEHKTNICMSCAVFFPGRLYHKDNKEAVLRWRRAGELQSDTDEDEGDMLLDANDLNQDEQELER